MTILFGSDEKTVLTQAIGLQLREMGHTLLEVGHLTDENAKWRWVGIGRQVAEGVAEGKADVGVVCCWSGTGVCMAANRVRGARAALCWDAETARLARKWDDANILCLSLRFTSETLAKEILMAFFTTQFDEKGLGEAHKLDR